MSSDPGVAAPSVVDVGPPSPAPTGRWLPIETAPLDGSPVYVRRIYQGRRIAEGVAVWDYPHDYAPMRTSPGPDPLARLTNADYAAEAAARAAMVTGKHWLYPDRMFCFPTPTEWLPDDGVEQRGSTSTTDAGESSRERA